MTSYRPVIISALWQYIKTHKLQDQHEKEFVNCDPFLKQIFQVENIVGFFSISVACKAKCFYFVTSCVTVNLIF